MVAAVRKGKSQRAVARRFRVPLSQVQYWVNRAGETPLAQVDWDDRPHVAQQVANKTSPTLERQVVALRQQLQQGELGFIGAESIHEALAGVSDGLPLPSVRTIGRILQRQGLLDGVRRVRRAAPPPGWYLPALAAGRAELDACDVIEDLRLEGGPLIDVLTSRALWGPVCGAWPAEQVSAVFITEVLASHWHRNGLPDFAQFDNDTRFQGGHNHPDVLGRVVRFCLALAVTPVFAPPAEHGFQNLDESFNGLWEAKVWSRFHHETVPALIQVSDRFTSAYQHHRARRIEQVPPRRSFPNSWRLDLQSRPHGQVIFLRRTDAQGRAQVLGHSWFVDAAWLGRLVRAEVDLDQNHIRFYRLRRNEPTQQPLVSVLPYTWPQRRFRDE